MEGRAQGGPANPAPRARWRRPVIAALITVALVSLVILIGYERMRDDAESDAAAGGSTPVAAVKRAAANDPAGARGGLKRPQAGHAGVKPSR